MSGVTGANRIHREDVEVTAISFVENILQTFKPYAGQWAISGSYYSNMKKNDFGDIDLIVQFNGSDKPDLKREFIKHVLAIDEMWIKPFVSEKYQGRRHYNSGEIVTVNYPQPRGSVQIDVVFALSEDEFEFKCEFLDLPAEKQGLILGLVKTIMVEEPIKNVMKRMGFKNWTEPREDQEYEWNISSSRLELRLVTLDDDYKELKRESVWESKSWKDVGMLLYDYDLDDHFDVLLEEARRNILKERSARRIVGMFEQMVTVKSGENPDDSNLSKGARQKGINKLQARNKIRQTLLHDL